MKPISKKSLYNLFIELTKKDRHSPEFKQLLSIFIRDITERNQFYNIHPNLKTILKKYNLFTSNSISMNQMRTLNKKLKKLGYESDKYAIQIEHWKVVKKIREELLSLELSNNVEESIDQIENYFIQNTDCFFKLAKDTDLQPNFIRNTTLNN